MPSNYTRALKKALRDSGCVFVRQCKGDHELWWSPHSNHKFVVDSKIKSRMLANEVLKQAGLPPQF